MLDFYAHFKHSSCKCLQVMPLLRQLPVLNPVEDKIRPCRMELFENDDTVIADACRTHAEPKASKWVIQEREEPNISWRDDSSPLHFKSDLAL